MLNTPIKSLDSNTPIDAFKAVYGEDLFYKLFDVINDEQKWVHFNHWQQCIIIKILKQTKFFFICLKKELSA